MKIYLAGLIQSGFVWKGNSQSENILLTEEVRNQYPYDLESYHYLRTTAAAPDYFREHKKSIFLDSGAYSMFTQGIKVELQEYADYIEANRDWIHIASNIDEIGRDKEQQSYNNQKGLEALLPKTKRRDYLCPVHHARDADYWLRKYLAEGYPYIFLGGMVPETTQYLRGWLDHIWDKFLTKRDGSAKVKVHGFGLTTLELIERYPWYSVDSTSWVLLGRYGGIYIDLANGRDTKIMISDQSPRVHDLDKHFDTLSPPVKEAIDERIRELGYDSALLRTHYGWRDHFNIQFFHRLCQRPDPLFVRRQATILGY